MNLKIKQQLCDSYALSRPIKVFLLAFVLGLGVVSNTFAALVDFDLLNDSSIYLVLDNQMSASVTNGGVIATLTASEGVLNRTASGFGINGAGPDDTDALNSNQWIEVVFDQAVVFSNLNVSSWGASSAGEVQLGSSFVSQGSIEGTGDTAYYFTINTGETVRIFATSETSASNGFSVDGFTVSIPEPAVLGFISLTGLGFIIVRRLML